MADPLLIDAGVSNSRLRQLLGPATILLHPLYGLGLLLLACLPLLPFASQPLGVLLAAFSTYLLLMAVRLEQPWLALTPLPPLTILCLGAWLRCGLGGLLLALGRPMALNDWNSGFWRHLPEAQTLWVIFMTAAVLVFACWPKPGLPGDVSSQGAGRQPLLSLSMACGLFAITSVGLGVLFGTLDRNPSSYLYWVAQRWRPDSLFTMLARFRDVFFLLAPLAISKAQRNWQRLVLLGFLLGYPALALPMGGRGLLLYPILYAVIGILLTPISIRALRLIIGATLIFGLIAIPSIETYRGMAHFQAASRTDLLARLNLLTSASQQLISRVDLTMALRQTGISLYGCSDGYLFQEPASSQPRAGWHRMQSLLTAWLPELVAPKTVPVRDAHIIAEEARGSSRQQAESMTYTSFYCISLGGDLYWRGGWPIVVLGSGLAAIAYRLVSSLWYRHAGWSSTWQILLLLYPATFLTMYPAGSIGETAWLWMWDLPKYVALIGMICFIAGKLSRKPAPTP